MDATTAQTIRTLIDVIGWPVAILVALHRGWLVNGPDHDAALAARDDRIQDLEQRLLAAERRIERWESRFFQATGFTEKVIDLAREARG